MLNARYGQVARIGLLGLLVVALLSTGGALFLRHKLEALRGGVVHAAQYGSRATVSMRSVSLAGLRGLHISDLRVSYVVPEGPSVDLEVPLATVLINPIELFYGRVEVSRVEVNRAKVHVGRPEGARWFPVREGATAADGIGLAALTLPPFRVVGRDCVLDVANVVAGSSFSLRRVQFDVSFLRDARELTGRLSALVGTDSEKPLQAGLRYASLEDFELRLSCDGLSADDANVFLPASQRFVTSGKASPRVRVEGRSDGSLELSLNGTVEGLAIRDMPEVFEPATGSYTVLAAYSLPTRALTFSTARVQTQQLEGLLGGSIRWDGPSPTFDLRLDASRLPFQQLLDTYMTKHVQDFGAVVLTIEEPSLLKASLTGTAEQPLLRTEFQVSGGNVSVDPVKKDWPSGEIRFGRTEIAWESSTRQFSGQMALLDGKVVHAESGIKAERLSGELSFAQDIAELKPFNALVTGNPMVGALRYDLKERRGELSVSGALSQIEGTILKDAIKDTTIIGAAGIRGKAVFGESGAVVDADLECTQTQVDYEWWFRKPAGMGATAKVHAELKPRSAITVTSELNLAGSLLNSRLFIKHNGKRMVLQTFDAECDSLDVVTAGQCISIPYRISGGTAKAAQYHWVRLGSEPSAWTATVALQADTITMLPLAKPEPVVCDNVTLEGTIAKNPTSGKLIVKAEHAVTPPLGSDWFVPIEPAPELREKFPDADRDWTYVLAADRIEMPPWKGTAFDAEAYTAKTGGGFKHYTATIDGGRIEGRYENRRPENAYHTAVKWERVPASYFMKYLNLPEVLSGVVTGNVEYGMDRDDPPSLTGKGRFDITEGKFNSDYVLTQLQDRMKGEMTALPASSLSFTSLSTDVVLSGNRVDTPNLELVSEGLKISGTGGFVRNGDMDYDLNVSLSPALAEQIPAIRDSITVQGHRLAQQNIDLSFKVAGPTFRPRSTVSGIPPVRVTLVSGALEVTSELIDFPRKVLVDLLKIGGGIVGAGAPRPQPSAPSPPADSAPAAGS